jgi:stage II sporulation protein D
MRSGRARTTVALAILAALTACTADPSRGPGPADGGPDPAGTPTETPTEPAPPRVVRLVAPEGASFLVRGRYPRAASGCVDPEQPKLLARYPGVLRVRDAGDGTMTLTVTLPFDRYLEGIAEVPPTWPRAALEAQAIAARSYALATTGWSGEEGEALDEPICATASCQVYHGIPVPREPALRRWVQAVRRTDGLVLLHDGRPATTVYFSTSNGQTYGNEDVFGSAPLPYLRPVVERDDGASGTSRWTIRVSRRDLGRFLAAADLWPGGRAVGSVRSGGDSIVVRGGGARRSIALDDLRDALNTWAPCLAPRRYPGSLPLTVPSRWFEAASDRRGLVLTGRGWGHGAGMVQWGAYGKARRGLSADRILAFYYGGLRPRRYPEPGTIHVEVASGLIRLTAAASQDGARLNGRELAQGRIVLRSGAGGLSIET